MSPYTFTISARLKKENLPLGSFLKEKFSDIPEEKIGSFYGFAEACPLYGGRFYFHRELSDQDISWIYEKNWSLKLPLTNRYADYQEYKELKSFFEKYHRKGNSIITVNDDLALWVKNDFPLYNVEASAIKGISTVDGISEVLKLYDFVVLPMRHSSNYPLLNSLPCKDQIILFANASCGFNCPDPVCFEAVSVTMKNKKCNTPPCSMPYKFRKNLGVINFDVGHLAGLGFKKFKKLNLKPALDDYHG